VSGRPGRALGLDLGTDRIGVAISDDEQTVATPLEVVDAKDRVKADLRIAELVDEWVPTIVVGASHARRARCTRPKSSRHGRYGGRASDSSGLDGQRAQMTQGDEEADSETDEVEEVEETEDVEETDDLDVGPSSSTEEPTSGVDKLLSRFGPVPAGSADRPAPGPRPASPTLGRPTGPRRSHPAGASAAATSTATMATPAPLFDEPHDDVFGEAPIGVGTWTDPESPPSIVEDIRVIPDQPDPVEVIDRRDWVRMPRRTGPVFRFLVIGLILGFAIVTIYSRIGTWWDNQYDPPGEPGSPVEFTIASGATANDVTQDLFSQGVIANPTLFRYWVADNLEGDFLAGEYICLQEDMSFEEALDCLDGVGPVPPTFFSITIPEGLRLEEIIDVLHAENPSFAKADLESDLQATLVSVGLTGVPDPPLTDTPDPTGSGKEGLLFPATYQIDEKKEADTLDILRRMADTMELKFTQVVDESGRDPVIGELELTDYEVLVIASLIEEEYLIDEDLGRISRVIYNRLVNGRFSLGIDATACYAAQKPCADLNQEDLDSESPWNTRNLQNWDLPPTPIASPGEKAIRAALNPDAGDWLFYVRTEEDGGHTFATTDAEFQAAKAVCQERGYC